METGPATRDQATPDAHNLLAVLAEMRSAADQKDARIQALEHQPNWFKRQLFGEKAEKRDMTDNPHQHTIADLLKDLPETPGRRESDTETITYQRGKAKKNALDGSPDDSGLRFDDSVPVEEIVLSAPELDGPDADNYTIISYKITHRLSERATPAAGTQRHQGDSQHTDQPEPAQYRITDTHLPGPATPAVAKPGSCDG